MTQTAIKAPADVVFSPAVKTIQTRKGSRESYAHVEQGRGWRSKVDEDLAAGRVERKEIRGLWFCVPCGNSRFGQACFRHRHS